MWSLIKIEFLKIWKNPRFLLFAGIMFCLNLACFVYEQNKDVYIPVQSYQKFERKLESLPNNQRYSYVCDYYDKIKALSVIEQLENLRKNQEDNQYIIESLLQEYPNVEKQYGTLYYSKEMNYYTDSLESEYGFIEDIKFEMDQLHRYPQLINQIQENAQSLSSISIFQKEETFTQKNMIKSAKDYQPLADIKITYELEKGIKESLEFPMTYFFLMVVMFVMVSYSIIDEKEKGLLTLLKTTPHRSLVFIKCLVMILSIGIFILCFYLAQLFYMELTCGLGDLTRSIQSLVSYQLSPLAFNVRQLLIGVILLKWIGASCLGLLMFVIALKCHSKSITLSFIVGIVMIEYALYTFIDPLSSLVLLKYLNFIFVLQAQRIFQIYLNVMVFNQIISLYSLVCIFVVVSYMILLKSAYFIYQQRLSQKENHFHLSRMIKSPHVSLSLFCQEIYKILWLQKGIIFLLLAFLLNGYHWSNTTIYRSQEELLFMNYMEVLEGPLNDQKEKYILVENLKFEELEKQMNVIRDKEKAGKLSREQSQSLQDTLQREMYGKEIFQEIFKQYQTIKENPQLSFVNSFGYNNLLLEPLWTLLPTIVTFLIMLIGIGNVYTYDMRYTMDRMIYIAPIGQHIVVRYKRIISFVVIFLFWFLMNIMIVYHIYMSYGMTSLMSSIRSISYFQNMPFDIPIVVFLIIHYFIQYFAFVCAGLICENIAKRFRHYIIGVFISVVIFVVPFIMTYGGYHFLDSISMYPLIMNGIYMQTSQGIIHIFILMLIYGILAVLSSQNIKREVV